MASMPITPNELRQKYLDFFKSVGHQIVPSASLIPENDASTLFTSAGMQPMMPYLLGAKHPLGKRIADSQKCFRAQDIEEVGDNRHTTFFEMLGNWSFGDYFKEQQLSWLFSFLVDEVGLDPARLFVSVFSGSQQYQIDQDREAITIWQQLFAQKGIKAEVVTDPFHQGLAGRIFCYPEKKNWWSRAGEPAAMPVGEPGGPDSEIFYDFGPEQQLHQQSVWAQEPCHPNCDCGRFLEIGNSVFMQYQRTETGFKLLAQQNIDFGGGLERMLAAATNEPDIFATDFFRPVIHQLEVLTQHRYQADERANFRIIADHLRAAVMLIGDGVKPGNKDQGYLVRRLIRRAILKARQLDLATNFLPKLTPAFFEIYAQAYPELIANQAEINQQLNQEEEKFNRTLTKGLKEFDRLAIGQSEFSPAVAFKLYESFGFPVEISLEEAARRGLKPTADFMTQFQHLKQGHASDSRTGSTTKFKGGLADQSWQTTKYHTLTHLLQAALRVVLGDQVAQAGSNNNSDRVRFDFAYQTALTPTQIQAVTKLVNEWIEADLPVTKEIMAKDQALKSGAMALFAQRYPDQVSVYTIGQPNQNWVSKEICGGPHVSHTGQIKPIEIFKEKSAAAGLRRIYAREKP